MNRSGELGQEQAQALLEELDRLGSVYRWAGAAITGEIEPGPDEYEQVAKLLDAARRWRERAAALNRTDLCVELVDLCAGRDLAEGGRAEYHRLLEFGTVDELRDVIEHLRVCPVVQADELHADPATTAAFVSAWAEYERRADEHRHCIALIARETGSRVARFEMTLADAERRLDALARTVDPEVDVTPVALILFPAAAELVRNAFKEGFDAARSR